MIGNIDLRQFDLRKFLFLSYRSEEVFNIFLFYSTFYRYLYSYEMHEKGVDITGKDTDSERSNDDKVSEESSTGRTSRNSLRIEERERQNEAKQLEGKTGKEFEKTKRNENVLE